MFNPQRRFRFSTFSPRAVSPKISLKIWFCFDLLICLPDISFINPTLHFLIIVRVRIVLFQNLLWHKFSSKRYRRAIGSGIRKKPRGGVLFFLVRFQNTVKMSRIKSNWIWGRFIFCILWIKFKCFWQLWAASVLSKFVWFLFLNCILKVYKDGRHVSSSSRCAILPESV